MTTERRTALLARRAAIQAAALATTPIKSFPVLVRRAVTTAVFTPSEIETRRALAACRLRSF